MMKKKPVYMTEEELGYLQHILHHFTDYMAGDNRPDHGMGILKGYRDLPDETRVKIAFLSGRLRRLHKKWLSPNEIDVINWRDNGQIPKFIVLKNGSKNEYKKMVFRYL
jgi:hypothetical protein